MGFVRVSGKDTGRGLWPGEIYSVSGKQVWEDTQSLVADHGWHAQSLRVVASTLVVSGGYLQGDRPPEPGGVVGRHIPHYILLRQQCEQNQTDMPEKKKKKNAMASLCLLFHLLGMHVCVVWYLVLAQFTTH